MPTYEYECTRCGLVTEEFKSMSAPRRQRCPACRGKVERLLSGGAGILFKGSGFYVTDSRAKNDTAKSDTPAAGTGTKAEAADKPAAAKDSGKGSKTKP
jgi:putative FmdB family regulatory protein